MEIFEKIGDAASKTYKYTAEKTSKFAKETKKKMEINDYKRNIKEIYIEIGETVYEKYETDQELNLEELLEKCERIQELSDKIVGCKDEILTLKERKQCKNCYEEIELSAKYCPNCGCEQEIINEEISESSEEQESTKEDENPENKEEKPEEKTDNNEEE